MDYETRPFLPVYLQLGLTTSQADPRHFTELALPSTSAQTYLAQAHVYDECARTLRRLHNATVPIHSRLPLEILMHILASLYPVGIQDIRLKHVCHVWRVVLDDTPEFWLHMLDDPSVWRSRDPGLLKRCLAQSKALLFQSLSAPSSVVLSEWTVPHLGRITHLKLNVLDSEFREFFRLVKDRRFSSLRSLTLVTEENCTRESTAFDAQAVPCSDADLPHLRRLEVSVEFFDHRLVVSSVESVSVLLTDKGAWLTPRLILSPQALCRALSRCSSGLATLDIDSALPATGWEFVRGPPILHLPALREIAVTARIPAPVQSFFSAVTFPPHTLVRITGVKLAGTPGISLSELLPEQCSLAGVCAADSVLVEQNYAALRIRTRQAGEELLSIELPGSPDRDIAADLEHLFRGQRAIRALQLYRLSDRVVPTRQLVGVLDAFPQLARLTIGVGRATSSFWQFHDTLAALFAVSRSTGRMLCPVLEDIAVVGVDPVLGAPWQKLVEMVAEALQMRRAALGRSLRSLSMDFDIPIGRHSSSTVGEAVLAQAENDLAAHVRGLADRISVSAEGLFRRVLSNQ
ncbi:hypothetical protein BD413DRAFT_625990 [Trametes elegans]|nr:hypothetical protein BD413DRAFT_625990 [Trametes elegans]